MDPINVNAPRFVHAWNSQKGRCAKWSNVEANIDGVKTIFLQLVLIDGENISVNNGRGTCVNQALKDAIFNYQYYQSKNNGPDSEMKDRIKRRRERFGSDCEYKECKFKNEDEILNFYQSRIEKSVSTFNPDYDLDYVLPIDWKKLSEIEKTFILDKEIDNYFRK
jgi:hypothetical protein